MGSPASWLPRAELRYTIGRLADVVDNTVRPGADLRAVLQLRPLPWLELEPDVKRAWLRQGEDKPYDESATQLLTIAHLDARQNLRLILQDRRSQRLGSGRHSTEVASLTYAWRHSPGTVLHLGASQQTEQLALPAGPGSAQQDSRRREVFIKLQVDADALRMRGTVGPAGRAP